MLRTITPPADDLVVVDLDAAKAHLRVDFSDDDALITSMVAVATEMAEKIVARRFLAQTVEWVTDNLCAGMRLPLAPVTGVVSIKYLVYPDGLSQATLDPADYIVSPDGRATVINKPYALRWPWVGQGPEPVVVRFNVGTADPTTIARTTKHAIMMLAGHFYNNREMFRPGNMGLSEVPFGVQALLSGEMWT